MSISYPKASWSYRHWFQTKNLISFVIPILVANLMGFIWMVKVKQSCFSLTDPNLMTPFFQGVYIYRLESLYFDVDIYIYIYLRQMCTNVLYLNIYIHDNTYFSSLAFFHIFGLLNSRDLLKFLSFISPRLESFRDLVLGLDTKTIPVVLQRPFTDSESAWFCEI